MKKDTLLLQLPIFLLLLISGGCKKNPVPLKVIPSISAISPANGSANTMVTISGTKFSTAPASNTVKFNGTTATVTSASASTLVVKAPAGGSTGPVTVTTTDGTATGPTFTYAVVAPPPTITSITPVSGSVGTVVTINGTNFKTTPTDNTVKFNGVAATVQTATASVLTVLTPATGTTGAITVSTIDGTATGPVFTYMTGPDVYVVGLSIFGQSYWKNGVRTDMPSDCFAARSIYVSGTDVYVAGVDINYSPKYWKNGVGVSLPMTSGHNEGGANSIFVSGTDVYVAGQDDINAAYSAPRCWKNGVALNMTYTVMGLAHSVFVSGGDVYVAGSQGPANGNLSAAYWKNGTPVVLTDGTSVAEATGMFVSGSDAYVCGYIEAPVQRVYWKNGGTVPLATPDINIDCAGRAIYVSPAGDVYVCGEYQNLAKYWKNGVMYDLTSTMWGPTVSETAFAMTGSGTDIYIAGISYGHGVGYWKNGVFTTLPGAQYVYGICVK